MSLNPSKYRNDRILYPSICFNSWKPYSVINLKPENGTGFGWSFPSQATIGSTPPSILGTATTDTHTEDRYTKKTSMIMIHSIVSFRTFFRVGCFKSKLCLYVINIIPSSLRRYFLLTEVIPFHTAMKFTSIPLGNMTTSSKKTSKRLQCITFTKAVFLKIFIGVPVNFSFLTSCTDLSKSNTVPVAEIRKSAYE